MPPTDRMNNSVRKHYKQHHCFLIKGQEKKKQAKEIAEHRGIDVKCKQISSLELMLLCIISYSICCYLWRHRISINSQGYIHAEFPLQCIIC